MSQITDYTLPIADRMGDMSQITDHILPPAGRDGQHDPEEIPGLLEPISNDAADLVIGFRQYGQMPVYRRFGRARRLRRQ